MQLSSDPFSRCAFSATVCDAAFVTIAAATLLYAFGSNPALALTLAGGAAFAFCLRLIHQWSQLRTNGICRTEIWQAMAPDELPHEAPAIRQAQARMEDMLLRFAKGASAVSAALFGGAFLLSVN
jgi:hypothetical protein